MRLSDVRDYVESLGIAEYVYMGKLPDKPDKAAGVYNSKRENAYQTALGGSALKSYGTKNVTILVHWNMSLRDTEEAAEKLFDALKATREVAVNNQRIKFIQPLYEVQDVGTDDSGVYEMVLEVAVIFER